VGDYAVDTIETYNSFAEGAYKSYVIPYLLCVCYLLHTVKRERKQEWKVHIIGLHIFLIHSLLFSMPFWPWC